METTTNNPITLGEIISCRRPVSNLSDENRTYDIAALVTVEEGEVRDITNGEVRVIGAGSAEPVAYFSGYRTDGNLSINFMDGTDREDVLSAISIFLSQLAAAF